MDISINNASITTAKPYSDGKRQLRRLRAPERTRANILVKHLAVGAARACKAAAQSPYLNLRRDFVRKIASVFYPYRAMRGG